MPQLTAAVVIGAERDRARVSLQHLLAQTAIDRLEIICVDLTPDGEVIPETQHPTVRYIPAGELEFFEAGMARCFTEARAPLIGFVEDHSFAAPEWAENVIKAFNRPDVALVNYSFTYAGTGTYLDRAFLVVEYGRWMAPTRPRPLSIPACNNIAYRLEALAPYRDALEKQLGVAPLMHTRLLEDGWIAWQEPNALVAHQGWENLWSGCWANGIMKRMYGGYRAERGKWSALRRIAYAGGMVLAPPLHLGRLFWSMRDRPSLWGQFASALPVSLVVYGYSSLQEALGYLFGPGRSREEYTAMELSVPRRT